MRHLTIIVTVLFSTNQALCQYSQETETYCSQASDLVRKKEYSHAIPILLKVIEIDSLGQCGSQKGFAYTQIASAYYQLGDTARAKANLDISIRVNPSDFIAKWQRAVLLSTQRKFNLAYQDLNELINEYPWMTDAYIQRGYLYYDEGKFNLAEADLTKALQLEANNDTPDKERQKSIKKFLRKIKKKRVG